MEHTPEDILEILDECVEAFTFPMLASDRAALAATRLSLYRSVTDWGLVIEVFAHDQGVGAPYVALYSFGSDLRERDPREDYVTRDAWEKYLRENPHNELRAAWPFDDESWLDEDDRELVRADVDHVLLRGAAVPVARDESGAASVCDLARHLAATDKEAVMATREERRRSFAPELALLLVLEEWRHPDLIEDELPSESETFQQLAEVLVSGDPGLYAPTEGANTHWRHWEEDDE